MKRSIYIACLVMGQLFGAPGCMDNSYHLTKMFDYKGYHYVPCNCPCEKQYKILADRGKCSKCQHYRDPHYSSMLENTTDTPLCLARPLATDTNQLIGFPKQLLRKF